MAQSMDEAVEQAWEYYEAELEMRLGLLVDDLVLRAPRSDGEEAFIALMVGDETPVRAQLVLTDEIEQELGDGDWEAILDLGWEVRPRALGADSSSSLISQQGDAEEIAAVACATMRSVLSVLSPEFIEEDEVPAEPPCCHEHTDGGCDVIVDAVTDSDQLLALVRGALECRFGVIEPDDDGDFPVRYGSAVVWVRVEPELPVIHMFSHVVSEVRKRGQAAIEVSLLNRDIRGVTFVLRGETVMAKADLWASVFSSEVFRKTLVNLASAVDALDEDLALRVRGLTFFQEAS